MTHIQKKTFLAENTNETRLEKDIRRIPSASAVCVVCPNRPRRAGQTALHCATREVLHMSDEHQRICDAFCGSVGLLLGNEHLSFFQVPRRRIMQNVEIADKSWYYNIARSCEHCHFLIATINLYQKRRTLQRELNIVILGTLGLLPRPLPQLTLSLSLLLDLSKYISRRPFSTSTFFFDWTPQNLPGCFRACRCWTVEHSLRRSLFQQKFTGITSAISCPR